MRPSINDISIIFSKNLRLRLCAGLALALAACGPPSEELTRVAAERAPLVSGGGDPAKTPAEALHAGDLVYTEPAGPALAWKGFVDQTAVERDGATVTVRRAPGDEARRAWPADLGERVKAPKSDWICAQVPPAGDASLRTDAERAACAARLRRIALSDGRTFAWDPCPKGPCRAVVIDGRNASAVAIADLVGARAVTVAGRPLVLATTKWTRDKGWHGHTDIVLRLSPKIERIHEIRTHDEEARFAPIVERRGVITVENDELHFRGARYELMPNRNILHEQPIHEIYKLPLK